jgi:hypothetical protein
MTVASYGVQGALGVPAPPQPYPVLFPSINNENLLYYCGTRYFFFFIILFICTYNVWVISPPFPRPLPFPYPLPLPSFHILSNTWYCLSFDPSNPSGCEVAFHCTFDLYFPDD